MRSEVAVHCCGKSEGVLFSGVMFVVLSNILFQSQLLVEKHRKTRNSKGIPSQRCITDKRLCKEQLTFTFQTFVLRSVSNDVNQIWNVFQEHHDALKLFWFTT